MFVLAWTSGHVPPRTMYYTEINGGWGAREDVTKAKLFKSQQQALDRWREIHAWPEDYEHCIKDGSVRSEAINQTHLNF